MIFKNTAGLATHISSRKIQRSGKSEVRLGCGFKVINDNYQKNYTPTILNNPTNFHKAAVLNLSNKILGK